MASDWKYLLGKLPDYRLASVGRTALSKGNKNTPLWIMSRFLAEELTRLSTTLRSTDLRLLKVRLVQSDKFKFPFKTFKTLSLIELQVRDDRLRL